MGGNCMKKLFLSFVLVHSMHIMAVVHVRFNESRDGLERCVDNVCTPYNNRPLLREFLFADQVERNACVASPLNCIPQDREIYCPYCSYTYCGSMQDGGWCMCLPYSTCLFNGGYDLFTSINYDFKDRDGACGQEFID